MAWWHHEVGYEVYIRSFNDADGDGVGDLQGIIDRLDQFAWLGVSTIWISPCMASPMRDHGYDVSDYTTIDPLFGDNEVYRHLCAEAHRRGMRVLHDLVPNHTSSEHPWFRSALGDRDSPYRDFYLWADPAHDGGPPNNWVSHFGGPAWTLDEATGEYYLHLFLPEQPDLNWHNPRVAEAFDEILEFWIDEGASGFRLDVAHALTKNPRLPDLPPAPPDAPRFMGREFEDFEHLHDIDQPDNVEVHRRWRRVVDPFDAVLLGEIYVVTARQLRRYLDPDGGLHLSFWFAPLHIDWTPQEVRRVITEAASLPAGRLAWVTGSHDRPRAASRYGGGELGRQRAMTMQMLQWGLPGVPWLYQGEELGLDNAVLRPDQMHDAFAVRNPSQPEMSRDLARTPMPWEPGEGMGFTAPGVEPWLSFGGRADADTWAVQQADEGSWLHAWRRLIAAWRDLPADLPDKPDWDGADDRVLAYRRGRLRVVANLFDEPVEIAVDRPGRVAHHRDPSQAGTVLPTGSFTLDPGAGVWLLEE